MNPWTVRVDYDLVELTLILAQHADQHRPKRPILLAIDQQFAERPRLRVPPVGLDRDDPLEVGEHQDGEQFGAGSPPEGLQAS